MRYYISQSPSNPLSRIIAGMIAVVCMAAAFFFGLVILAVIAGAIALFSLVFWFRSLWVNRHEPTVQPQPKQGKASGELIEGEYTVISERRD
jgi:hypothetical protein